jgi:hypothetical protein
MVFKSHLESIDDEEGKTITKKTKAGDHNLTVGKPALLVGEMTDLGLQDLAPARGTLVKKLRN